MGAREPLRCAVIRKRYLQPSWGIEVPFAFRRARGWLTGTSENVPSPGKIGHFQVKTNLVFHIYSHAWFTKPPSPSCNVFLGSDTRITLYKRQITQGFSAKKRTTTVKKLPRNKGCQKVITDIPATQAKYIMNSFSFFCKPVQWRTTMHDNKTRVLSLWLHTTHQTTDLVATMQRFIRTNFGYLLYTCTLLCLFH